MEDQIRKVIIEKLADAVEMKFPSFTPREAKLSTIKGKAHAVIGMRRAGKTTFLQQCLVESLIAGKPRKQLIYFNFEDDRLGAMASDHLTWIIEEYYRQFPTTRRAENITFCFDEIQLVSGWERFIRRIMDTENVQILLSGSSARLLSREVATSMRGRAIETVITPFSFREFLAHKNIEISSPNAFISGRTRSHLISAFDDYVRHGGFPEAQSIVNNTDLIRLLQGYVDVVLFRDVAERYKISNLVALRALVRQLLRCPATPLSISKISHDFRSRGIPVSKETLLTFLLHLEDAFLITTLNVFSRSERRQQVNPRKLYLADHALAIAFSPSDDLDRGHLIENIVACELLRRSKNLNYFRTRSGLEVDFFAFPFEGKPQLIQVTTSVSKLDTFNREIRALIEAQAEYPAAELLLLVEEEIPKAYSIPKSIQTKRVWHWLLDRER